MSKYIIKTELNPMGGGNPEYAPGKELRDGIEVDGFAILTFKDDMPHCIAVHDMTVMDLARMFASKKDEGGSIIWQAIAIAEGLEKADRIREEAQKRNVAKELADLLWAK